ncbi:hypothetical protein OF83DRAFT_1057564, partial [Amylostereum chailletii]
RSLRLLRPGRYLNDALMNFGLRCLMFAELRSLKPGIAEEIYVFETFFFAKLYLASQDRDYEGVQRWNVKCDLFKKNYVLVPIHDHVRLHWYLAIILHPGRIIRIYDKKTPSNAPSEAGCKIFILDSLGFHHQQEARKLGEYLRRMACQKKKVPWVNTAAPDTVTVPVPRQPNNVDCGIYLLHFARTFVFRPATSAEALEVE